MFDNGLEKNPRKRPNGEIPVGVAFENNKRPVFLYMFEKLIDKNLMTNWLTGGNTLLHEAVLKKDLETCKLVIKNQKSDKNLPNREGVTPVHQASNFAA